jgi:hypothetical protein
VFTLTWTKTAQATYEDLTAQAAKAKEKRKLNVKQKSSKQEGLLKQVEKTLRLLAANPKHPGLHTHEYDVIENPYDKNQKAFEAYAQNATPSAYCVFWCYGPKKSELTVIAITPHP